MTLIKEMFWAASLIPIRFYQYYVSFSYIES